MSIGVRGLAPAEPGVSAIVANAQPGPERPGVLYMANPSSPSAQAAMSAGVLGCMTTPRQGNLVPPGAWWASDNGRFGKGSWPGYAKWYAWLAKSAVRWDRAKCRFAVAPDTPFDAAATLAEAEFWLPRIRALGLPAALAAQDGIERMKVDWASFDVLFLAGSTAWKLSTHAQRLAAQALENHKRGHMGRVNSLRRMKLAEWFGAESADGTFLTRAPDKNLPRVRDWLDQMDSTPSLVHDRTSGVEGHPARR